MANAKSIKCKPLLARYVEHDRPRLDKLLGRLEMREKHIRNVKNKLVKLWDKLKIRNTDACIAASDSIYSKLMLSYDACERIYLEIKDYRTEEMKVMIKVLLEAGWTLESIKNDMIKTNPTIEAFIHKQFTFYTENN